MLPKQGMGYMFSYEVLRFLRDNGIENIPTDLGFIKDYKHWFNFDKFMGEYPKKGDYKITWIALCIMCDQIIKHGSPSPHHIFFP